ncbi:hypothetical protein [Aureimonas sp. SK2]|uniref:hypothetical protein n=1 Tax=Aureimonas sp. SK2 TaxID=3015992 RepID=UPI00244443CB|nr:hypothetical protein [Aureimonas sp. SK2]
MLGHFKTFPGVVTDDTPYASQGFATASNHVRWVEGKAEMRGGYVDATPGFLLPGKTRSQRQWTTVRGQALAALGWTEGLFVVVEKRVHDVTPLLAPFDGTIQGLRVFAPGHGVRPGQLVHVVGGGVGSSLVLPQDPFRTAAGLSQVLVTADAHGLPDNTLLRISGAALVDGESVNGLRTVLAAGPDTLVLHLDEVAAATVSAGGTPTIDAFQACRVVSVDGDAFIVDAAGNGQVMVVPTLPPDREDGVLPGGYGVGPFGANVSYDTRAAFLPRVWALDTFGETLVAAPIGGALYRWDPNPSKQAVVVPNAPAHIDWLCVTAERVLMAFGCTHLDGIYDPLAVRWCNVGDFDAWTPSSANIAGDDRFGRGSYIVAGFATDAGVVVWTDTAVYGGAATGDSSQFYRFDTISDNCGLVSPNAVVVRADGECWWLGPGNVVYALAGGKPHEVDCPVTSWITVDPVQAYKVFACTDSRFTAVTFYAGGRYIRLDTKEAAADPRLGWSVGTHDMTTFGDLSVMGYAMSVRDDGKVCRRTSAPASTGSRSRPSCASRRRSSPAKTATASSV